jgi:uncharacterized protein YbaR (Trm112 family)
VEVFVNFLCPQCKNPLLETFDSYVEKSEIKVRLYFACPICDKKFGFKLFLFEEKSKETFFENKVH